MLVDNEASSKNVQRFASRMGHSVQMERLGADDYRLSITVQEGRADVPLLFSSRQDAPVFERGDRRPLMNQNKEEET